MPFVADLAAATVATVATVAFVVAAVVAVGVGVVAHDVATVATVAVGGDVLTLVLILIVLAVSCLFQQQQLFMSQLGITVVYIGHYRPTGLGTAVKWELSVCLSVFLGFCSSLCLFQLALVPLFVVVLLCCASS